MLHWGRTPMAARVTFERFAAFRKGSLSCHSPSKMGKSAHVRTSVEPHSNLKLVSLFRRGSKMGKSAHVQTSVEPHSNLKRYPARTILATPERVRKQVRNLHLSLGGFETLHVRVIHEKFQHFITTLIPENSTKFVVKRDLRSARQSCGHRLYNLGCTIPFATLSWFAA